MKPASQRGFAAALLALLVILAIAASLLQPPAESPAKSVDASEPNGRRALLLLLRESGFDAGAWREAPARLPREEALLWLSQVPPEGGPIAPKPSERTEELREQTEDLRKKVEEHGGKPEELPEEADPPASPTPSPARAGAFGLEHYRTFLEAGGNIVLPASDAARKFLAESLGIDPSEIPASSASVPAGVRTFVGPGGETMEVDVAEGGLLLLASPGHLAQPLLSTEGTGGEDLEVLAVALPVGRGAVVLLGDDTFLANTHIGEHDHAILAVRLAEWLAPGKRVLFDEYALGTWSPGSPASILASPMLFLATLHALLLIGILVVRAAWSREFPRDPLSQATVSPLLRARALAGLLARAGRFDVLSKLLVEGAARGVERRSPETARKLLAHAATPSRSAADLDRLAGEVRAIERAAG